MNDGTLKACFGMGMVVALYAVYMFTTSPAPDGVIFTTVLAAVVGLAGYVYGTVKKK
jgi:hypothetical protein